MTPELKNEGIRPETDPCNALEVQHLPAHGLAREKDQQIPEEFLAKIRGNPELLDQKTFTAVLQLALEKAHLGFRYGNPLDFDALDNNTKILYFAAKEYATWLLESVFSLRVVKDIPISKSIRVAREHLEEEKNASRFEIAKRAFGEIINGKPAKTRTEIIEYMEEIAAVCEGLERKIATQRQELSQGELAWQERIAQNTEIAAKVLLTANKEVAKAWGEGREAMSNQQEKLQELLVRNIILERRNNELEANPKLEELKKLVAFLGEKKQIEASELLSKLGVSKDLIDYVLGKTTFEAGSFPIGKMCGLQVVETKLGTQVTFTIPAGSSGAEILELIEKNNPRKDKGDGVAYPKSELLKDAGLKTEHKMATTYTFVVCKDAHSKDRTEQGEYLSRNNLKWTEKWVATVGAALFRDMHGFPNKRDDIATASDKGDLFKGLSARASAGFLLSNQDGLHGNGWGDDGARSSVVAVGTPEL